MNIDKEQLEWLDKQIKTHVFSNISAGIRQCIRVAKRVIEGGNPYEIAKFFHGIHRDVVHINKQTSPSDLYWRKTLTRVDPATKKFISDLKKSLNSKR